jgi:hypothetical protein
VWLATIVVYSSLAGALLWPIQPASAETIGPDAAYCMQTNYNNHGDSQKLNCNANDVRVAKAIQSTLKITAGGSCAVVNGVNTCTCDPTTNNGKVTFEADFQVQLTATARYDYGIYWSADGDTNGDGAYTGQCLITTATGNCGGSANDPANQTCTSLNNVRPAGTTIGGVTSGGFKQLDGSGDTCGDITSDTNNQLVHLILEVPCVPGAGGKLALPYCTSWRQPGSNETCDSPDDAFPGAPSKCSCDANFTVGIDVKAPTLKLDKTATPTAVDEPGGSVQFSFQVTKGPSTTTATLDQIEDDTDNNGTKDTTYAPRGSCPDGTVPAGQTCIPCSCGTNCTINGTTNKVELGANGVATCTVTRSVSGNAGDSFTDKACVQGHFFNPVSGQNQNIGATIASPNTDSCDTATVAIRDVTPTATITKTVDKAVCATVRYKVKVDNTDTAEALTLSALTDDKAGGSGSITSVHDNVKGTTCGVTAGQNGGKGLGTASDLTAAGALGSIAASGNYQCFFDVQVCSFPQTDTVTGTLSDNDGTTISPTGSATVDSVTVNTP